ncbi:MAG TPA: hypothetical protein VHD35_13015 [Chitinophagaceae bacterium]|nr:hypothetical protein [Chitinophagaceae bacterium]
MFQFAILIAEGFRSLPVYLSASPQIIQWANDVHQLSMKINTHV